LETYSILNVPLTEKCIDKEDTNHRKEDMWLLKNGLVNVPFAVFGRADHSVFNRFYLALGGMSCVGGFKDFFGQEWV